jgi:single-strand DNA-binding protein
MYQKLIVVGNLGGDPEMKEVNGQSVTTFSLAVNRRWNNAQGQQVDETTWFRVSVWGRRAEVANEYLTKGSKVLVEGRLKPDAETGGPRLWTRQDGTPAASFEMTADNFSFVGSKGDNATNETPRAEPVQRQQAAEPQFFENEDDIPF